MGAQGPTGLGVQPVEATEFGGGVNGTVDSAAPPFNGPTADAAPALAKARTLVARLEQVPPRGHALRVMQLRARLLQITRDLESQDVATRAIARDALGDLLRDCHALTRVRDERAWFESESRESPLPIVAGLGSGCLVATVILGSLVTALASPTPPHSSALVWAMTGLVAGASTFILVARRLRAARRMRLEDDYLNSYRQ